MSTSLQPVNQDLENHNPKMEVDSIADSKCIQDTSWRVDHVRPLLPPDLRGIPLISTGSPSIICTELPHHWRSNKSLPHPFIVFSMCDVPDGATVTLRASNEENICAELRNSIGSFRNNLARFNDLRFVGRSGRGKCFNISITIKTIPQQVASYWKAIKVTVDGPREPRNKNQKGDLLSSHLSLPDGQRGMKRPYSGDASTSPLAGAGEHSPRSDSSVPTTSRPLLKRPSLPILPPMTNPNPLTYLLPRAPSLLGYPPLLVPPFQLSPPTTSLESLLCHPSYRLAYLSALQLQRTLPSSLDLTALHSSIQAAAGCSMTVDSTDTPGTN